MTRASRITASALGVYAGALAIQHGIFEIQQGNQAPAGLMINAIGPPCRPDAVWHSCYPAMTLIPNLLVTGLLATLVGSLLAFWALFFVRRKFSGQIIIALAMTLLLVGGGFIPVWIGITAGIAALWIDRPPGWFRSLPRRVMDFLAWLWPWTLVLLLLWAPGSWIFGRFFGPAMLELSMLFFLFFDLLLPVLTLLSAFASDLHDSRNGWRGEER